MSEDDAHLIIRLRKEIPTYRAAEMAARCIEALNEALRSARRSALLEAAAIAERHGKSEPYGHAKARANMIANELVDLADGEEKKG